MAEAFPTPLVSSCSLQHMKPRRSTSRGLYLPTRFRPQGLATLSTISSLLGPTGFVSHQQHSWDSPFEAFPSREVTGCFHSVGPTCRLLVPCSHDRSRGSASVRSTSGLCPSRECLATELVFSVPVTGGSLGFLERPFVPEHSSDRTSGLCIHLSSRRALLSTGRWSLEVALTLPKVFGIA